MMGAEAYWTDGPSDPRPDVHRCRYCARELVDLVLNPAQVEQHCESRRCDWCAECYRGETPTSPLCRPCIPADVAYDDRHETRGKIMGLFRKTTSALTLGAVDFRSDKERVARYARQTRNAVRAQSAMQAQLAATPQPVMPVQQAPAPGWYQHPADPPGVVRWFDGRAWSQNWYHANG